MISTAQTILFPALRSAGSRTSATTRSRFGHTVRRPGQFVCPNSDTIRPNNDKKYLTVVMFRFLLLLLLIDEKRDSFLPSGSWIILFWLPAETLSLKRLRVDFLVRR